MVLEWECQVQARQLAVELAVDVEAVMAKCMCQTFVDAVCHMMHILPVSSCTKNIVMYSCIHVQPQLSLPHTCNKCTHSTPGTDVGPHQVLSHCRHRMWTMKTQQCCLNTLNILHWYAVLFYLWPLLIDFAMCAVGA